MEIIPKVQPKRKYVHRPEIQAVLRLQARVDGLKRLIKAKAAVAAKAKRAQRALDEHERKIKQAKKVLVRGI